MWDKRYSTKEYAYGTEPNHFLQQSINSIPKGKVLSLAEGEGRNAVFLAKHGYTVTAVDSSIEGIKKGIALAKQHNVEVEFVHSDVLKYDIGEDCWDGIISIFFPLKSSERKVLYKNVVNGLKNNGVLLLEAYTPQQLKFGTGGGKSVEVMQSKQSLLDECEGLDFTHLMEVERSVVEGIYHTGMGAVVQAIAKKKL
jgi:SAM-dependent methyltransferase